MERPLPKAYDRAPAVTGGTSKNMAGKDGPHPIGAVSRGNDAVVTMGTSLSFGRSQAKGGPRASERDATRRDRGSGREATSECLPSVAS